MVKQDEKWQTDPHWSRLGFDENGMKQMNVGNGMSLE
jgi:hypothetical protein